MQLAMDMGMSRGGLTPAAVAQAAAILGADAEREAERLTVDEPSYRHLRRGAARAAMRYLETGDATEWNAYGAPARAWVRTRLRRVARRERREGRESVLWAPLDMLAEVTS